MAGRILVLDDEENYAEMLQDLLRENNYRVDMATRPERAIGLLEEIPYDLVISDYKMPVMDGADFLKKARELYPDLPFILVSGLMNTPELVKVANMSVTLVMEKPLDTEAFLQHVARFSKPMTEQEKGGYALELENDGALIGQVVPSYPEEPRFFSAVSPQSMLFLKKAWSLANSSRELFMIESKGGDAELAARDISVWRGNSDLRVGSFDLPASNEEAIPLLRGILSGMDHSNTVCIHLLDVAQVPQARALTVQAAAELVEASQALFIYLIESDNGPTLLNEIGEQGVVLPPLSVRPADVAAYVCRFAKIVSERLGKRNCSELSPEAAYLILAYQWPRGYKQIQDVMAEVVHASRRDEAISAELLKSVLGSAIGGVASPESRLYALLRVAQRSYFEKEMQTGGLSASELARKLGFDSTIKTRDDLLNMPLILSDLAKL